MQFRSAFKLKKMEDVGGINMDALKETFEKFAKALF
jgi:hypothetical protein